METIVRVLDFLRSEIFGASLIHWLMPILMIFGIGILLFMFAKRSRIKKVTICPVLHEQVTLELDANVFRDSSKRSGLDVVACTEFLDGKVTCGKDCLHNPDVQKIHAEEKRKHQEDMKKGNTIIP